MTLKKVENISDRDKRIGERLRQLREKEPLSVQQLADKLDMDYKELWSRENGYNALTINLILKMQANNVFQNQNLDLMDLFRFLIIADFEKHQ